MSMSVMEEHKLYWEVEVLKAQHAAALADARHHEELARANELTNFRNAHSPAEDGDFLFSGAVDTEAVDGYMAALSHFHDRNPSQPITFRINSGGGSIVQGFALFDMLLGMKQQHRLTTVAYGMVASMGGILFQAGHVRKATPHSHMLIHEGSVSYQGAAGAMADTIKFSETLRGQCLDVLAGRSTLSKEEIAHRWERKDWWLDAATMKEFGFADEVAV